ncbi:hypothetical protein [Kaarinaea lacus]
MLSKNLKFGVSATLLSIMLMFSPFVFAQPGMDDFNKGVASANAGDFNSALKQFLKAKKAGLDSPALQFNLGVSYYKLAQYEKARKEFDRLKNLENYKQLANFNLGLIANKQDKKAEAIAAFQLSLNSGDSEKIKLLSREALKRLGVKPEETKKPSLAGLLTLSYATDSNVALVNDDLAGVSETSDNSVILSALATNWLTGDSGGGWRLFLQGYKQNYNTETVYNYSQLGAGLARYSRIGEWRMRYGGYWDETSLGGTSYQRILTAEVRGRKSLSKSDRLELRYRFNSIISMDTTYDYLEGNRQQMRAAYQTNQKEYRVRAYYEYEMNDRADDDTGNATYSFISYSPNRHSLRLTAWWDITREWELRLDARHRVSTYNDDHELIAGGTDLRKDTQNRYSARLRREMMKDLDLEVAYTLTNNDSSIDAESYNRKLLSLGAVWKF